MPNINFEDAYLPLTKGDKHLELCKTLNATYRSKNADYKDSFSRIIDENGEVSAIVRLKDKVYRLENLLDNPAQVDETKIETCLDGANYFIMYAMKLMERQENNG
jgi:hypothetical protein